MKRTAIYILAVVILTAGAVGVLRFVSSRVFCQAEKKLEIDDPAGYRFEVEYKSCDTLAKEEYVSVYATRVSSKSAGLFSKWKDQRMLLFRYDPGREDNPLPSVTWPSQSEILISIPEVSSIEYQNYEWEQMSVKYSIGRVDYPTAQSSTTRPSFPPRCRPNMPTTVRRILCIT